MKSRAITFPNRSHPGFVTNGTPGSAHIASAAIAGLCASLVGIGLARFAYSPLIPALVAAGWFTPTQAIYLGAANLAGYLVGAVAARQSAEQFGARVVLRSMMLLASVSFLACAIDLPFGWFFGWRLAAGIAGGSLMVLAATAILPFVAKKRRGFVGGVIFTGVGAGIALSGRLIPLLLRQGLVATWLAIGSISTILTIVAWQRWPSGPPGRAADRGADDRPVWSVPALATLVAAYGLNAVGLVPHMVFLADFVARGLGRGIEAGSNVWVCYGLGAIAGPLVVGRIADRIGFRLALRGAFLMQACAVALPVLSTGSLSLTVSAVVVGAFTPGIVPLVLGRIQELIPSDPAGQRRVWGFATMSFALFQAVAAYAYSFAFAHAGQVYLEIFVTGAGATALAFVVDCVGGRYRADDPGQVGT